MRQKNTFILATLIALCAVGLLSSFLFNWPVSTESASGNIGKASRFSRKIVTEPIDNMEELLRTDEDYKSSIVLAYSVMYTRAVQFGTLVDMSNQAAGGIPEFEGILQEMNDNVPVFTNVANALMEAGEDLNAVLSDVPCPEVAQSTMNAALSYTTLQKQNGLADRFIDTTDEYVRKTEAPEDLMLVRDLWVDYQQMTAALEGDKKAARALDKKGTLLTAEQALKASEFFRDAEVLNAENNGTSVYKDILNRLVVDNVNLSEIISRGPKFDPLRPIINPYGPRINPYGPRIESYGPRIESYGPSIMEMTPVQACQYLNIVIRQTAEGNVVRP